MKMCLDKSPSRLDKSSSSGYAFLRIILFSLTLLFGLFSCSVPPARICIREGEQYCTTSDWIYVIDWDPCYRRGINCMEGECWEQAIEEFKQAIADLDQDMRNARPYGMHFRDYFPHREMGICYFHLGYIDEAIRQLKISMKQAPSARAKYYLNQAHRAFLIETGLDTLSPIIHLEYAPEESLTNQTPLLLKGTVRDDQYVASISINQDSLFIELAEPSLPFSHTLHLEEGWNMVKITATDLVGRKTEEVRRIYLDQQGPSVMAQSVQPDHSRGEDRVFLSALVHDESGLSSFTLDGKEMLSASPDKTFLIEEHLPLSPGLSTIPFRAQDKAGNVTEGEFSLLPGRRRVIGSLPRLASNDNDFSGIFLSRSAPAEKGILFDIKKPEHEETETYYEEIFLEGKIESREGIKMVKLMVNLNEVPLFDLDKILAGLKGYKETPNRIYEIAQRYNLYYLNKGIKMDRESVKLRLQVVDHMGRSEEKEFTIKRIPRSQVFEIEQQMSLAVIPFDLLEEDASDPELIDYIDKTIVNSFSLQERFEVGLQDKLPWPMIDEASKHKQTSDKKLICKIGKSTGADGVICGHIKRWLDGFEIKAEYRDTQEGKDRLSHDVFTPVDTPKELMEVISGLAMKFRDAFPVCYGEVMAKEGQIIYVDMGKEKGIFPGLKYNVSKDGKNLFTKASVKDVTDTKSEAKIGEHEKSKRVERGDYVRTR